MLEVSFNPYYGAPCYDRVEIRIENYFCIDIDALLDFAHSQFPHMCGPIHVTENNVPLAKMGDCWIPEHFIER